MHVIYVMWAGGICLICMHKPEGAQHLRASANISGKSGSHMLHMLCNTPGTLKIAEPAFHYSASLYSYECCLWLWVLILTLL